MQIFTNLPQRDSNCIYCQILNVFQNAFITCVKSIVVFCDHVLDMLHDENGEHLVAWVISA